MLLTPSETVHKYLQKLPDSDLLIALMRTGKSLREATAAVVAIEASNPPLGTDGNLWTELGHVTQCHDLASSVSAKASEQYDQELLAGVADGLGVAALKADARFDQALKWAVD